MEEGNRRKKKKQLRVSHFDRLWLHMIMLQQKMLILHLTCLE